MKRNKLSTFFTEQIEESKLRHILVFDAHNLFYRCLHVANNEFQEKRNAFLSGTSNKEWFEKDMFNYWKHLVLNSFLFNIQSMNPNRVILAVDDRNYWRKGIYSEYKAQRKDDRDKSTINFDLFFKVMKEFINNLKEQFTNILVLQVNNCEADDIIAVITKHLSGDNLSKIVLISNDRDFFQLQKYKNFKQYHPMKKIFVKSINSERDLEIKILTGDKSDNISGIKKGVGEKTAAKLLDGGIYKKQTLDQLFEDKEIKDNYIRNKKLIDFENIPPEIHERILNAYNNYELKPIDSLKIWDWLAKEKLNKLNDDFQMYLKTIKRLN